MDSKLAGFEDSLKKRFLEKYLPPIVEKRQPEDYVPRTRDDAVGFARMILSDMRTGFLEAADEELDELGVEGLDKEVLKKSTRKMINYFLRADANWVEDMLSSLDDE